MAKATMPLLALALLGIAVAAPMSGEARTGPAKCKGRTIPVKVNGKRTCKRLASVLPKPKPVAPRLAYLRTALKFDASKAGRRHGKQHRSRKRALRAAGKARKRLVHALPKVLTIIDARAQSALKSNCGPIVPEGPPGKTDGLSVRAGTDAHGGDAKGGFVEYTVNGFTS